MMQATHDFFELSSTVKIHNQGVQCFRERRYGEAVKLFSCVLSTVKRLLRLGVVEEEGFAQARVFSRVCRFLPDESEEVDEEDAVFFFNCPLIITANEEAQLDECRDDLVNLCQVTLYNLALTYQSGASEAKDQSKLLDKALIFYGLLQQIKMSGNEEFALVLNMAIANNSGLVHRQRNRNSEEKLCFHRLLTLVMYAIDCGAGNSIVCLDHFVRNLQITVMNHKPNAPSA